LATVGGVIVAGVFAAFITGRSATIPQGRELMAHTQSDLALALPVGQIAVAIAPAPASFAADGALVVQQAPEAAPQAEIMNVSTTQR